MGEFENKLVSLGLLKVTGMDAARQPIYASLSENTVYFALSKQTRTMHAITGNELISFARDMDAEIRYYHPAVKELIVRKALSIVDCMRTVIDQTKGGYGGSVGSANGLWFTVSWAYDYIDPDVASTGTVLYPYSGHGGATNNRRTWTRVVTTPSTPETTTPFITGIVSTVGTSTDLESAEEEGYIFLGMADKAGVDHLATTMQVVYNSEDINYWGMPFDLLEEKDESLLVWEMPQDIAVPPEQSVQINVRYNATGTSYLRPIVIRFLRSKDMRKL